MTAERAATFAGRALLALAAAYIGGHVLHALGIDPIRAAFGAVGLVLAAVVIVAALVGRSPAR